MKFLLDTDHISILQKQSGPEFIKLAARIAQHSPGDLAFSVISFHEQILGCHTYLSRAHTSTDLVRGYAMLSRVQANFAAATVVPFDTAAASVLDGFLAQRIRVATMDLRIAAIAMARRLTLLTRNKKDFSKVPGLMMDDWTV